MSLTEKIIWPEPGHYLVAVSGGVDSISLLYALAKKGDYKLDVAFIDHGWREVEGERELVHELAGALGVEVHERSLDLKGDGEEEARVARYGALKEIRTQVGARASVTAHHLDDRIETVLMQVMRGSGRQGLSVLRSTDEIIRPLLGVKKPEIVEYAQKHDLKWVEDPTNKDLKYRRNYVRHELIPQLQQEDPDFEDWIMSLIQEAEGLNHEVDLGLAKLIHELTLSSGDGAHELSREALRRLPVEVLQEVLVSVLRKLDPLVQLDRRTVESLTIDIKTGHIYRPRQLTKQLFVDAQRDKVTVAFKAH
ncbi:tRNA lysidine(34) synthetase TilS [Patescibacteria group bacterium]|nr:MAG: tRNA lysidine(34) synthetase TilS [Patescibacteria group bacterium]